jgi:hypothetical protein
MNGAPGLLPSSGEKQIPYGNDRKKSKGKEKQRQKRGKGRREAKAEEGKADQCVGDRNMLFSARFKAVKW